MWWSFLGFVLFVLCVTGSPNLFLVSLLFFKMLVYKFNFDCVWYMYTNTCYFLNISMLFSKKFSTIIVDSYSNATMSILYIVNSSSF